MSKPAQDTTVQPPCTVCGGTGSVSHTSKTNGYWQHRTELCGCRRDLPRREGVAQWWKVESIFDRSIETFFGPISVAVRTEVPISADNYPLIRHGNRYYPTFVELDGRWMFAETAAEIGRALIWAANIAERTDERDRDTCGHWAPCDCQKAAG